MSLSAITITLIGPADRDDAGPGGRSALRRVWALQAKADLPWPADGARRASAARPGFEVRKQSRRVGLPGAREIGSDLLRLGRSLESSGTNSVVAPSFFVSIPADAIWITLASVSSTSARLKFCSRRLSHSAWSTARTRASVPALTRRAASGGRRPACSSAMARTPRRFGHGSVSVRHAHRGLAAARQFRLGVPIDEHERAPAAQHELVDRVERALGQVLGMRDRRHADFGPDFRRVARQRAARSKNRPSCAVDGPGRRGAARAAGARLRAAGSTTSRPAASSTDRL